uniref:kin of IRRE-like protein 1 isoform X1 n=1 Tax=Styela clava TaxID=7725 RepID=UPI0019396AEE|nr:kin of IRRE-like protein 1 isoform X1 [Styela clava]
MSSSGFTVLCVFGVLFIGFVNANSAPIIVEHPSDVTTVVGRDVILRCVVENLPIENDIVQWTKGGFALGYDPEIPAFSRLSMVGDVSIGEYNLQIQNVTLKYEGEYECQVRVDRMRTKATVTVLVPPKGPMVEDVRDDDVIDVLAHSDNLITCRSWGGKPAGKLAWYKDGAKITENVTYAETEAEQKLRNSSATLRLWPTELEDGHRYECLMSADPRFQDFGFSGEVLSKTVKLNVQKPPVASLTISSSTVKEGGNLFARCDSYSSKPPAKSYIWYLNGETLEGRTGSTLAMYNVNRTLNEAIVGCRAVSDVGQSGKSSVSLNVLYAPRLVIAPENVITNMSTTVNMTCSWDSNPPALVAWYKRGNMDVAVVQGEDLIIDVIDQSAAGTYVCVADAQGVASKSVSARLDVLGPPIFINPTVQEASLGERAIVNCSLGSTPGVSHVTWSWQREKHEELQNNDTIVYKNQVKFAGIMNYDQSTASLVIYDVKPEDLIKYNCTVHNSYGTGSTTITMEEKSVESLPMMVPIAGAIVGAVLLLIIVIIVAICCVRSKRQQKSTTFPPEKESLQVERTDGHKKDSRMDILGPAGVKLISPDADSDNPSTSASLSSRDVVRPSLALDEYRSSAHNDDGYHTEEANSWNRHEKQSPESSPARSTRDDYSRGGIVTSMPITSSPMGAFERAASPYGSSDVASDGGYLKYNLQPMQPYTQYPMHQFTPSGVVELPPMGTGRAMSPVNMYGMQHQYPATYYQHHQGPPSSSSGYRGPAQFGVQRPRAGSNAPSVISSHRSVTPSPAYAQLLGRSTPVSVLGDRAMYTVPMNSQGQAPIRRTSSQSSLEQPPSSVATHDQYENPTKMSQLSSRMSLASRSSEVLNKPMTARMATHV